MLSAVESSAIVTASVALAILLLFLLRRMWSPNSRLQHNDTFGWQISFLGTTYAVIIAFMLSDVWANFQAAETNAEVEANALVNVYRVAAGLPAEEASNVKSLARRYATSMLQVEWPAMDRGDPYPASSGITHELWKSIMQTKPQTSMQQASVNRALEDLTTLTEHRRIRQLQSRTELPVVFWVVLVSGGLLTVIYTCLFGVEDLRVHMLQVSGTTFFVALVLVTIADVDQPYRGALRIQPTCFELALKTFDALR